MILDHFGDVNEMVLHLLAAVEAGQARLLNHLLEVAVVRVTEHAGKLATTISGSSAEISPWRMSQNTRRRLTSASDIRSNGTRSSFFVGSFIVGRSAFLVHRWLRDGRKTVVVPI